MLEAAEKAIGLIKGRTLADLKTDEVRALALIRLLEILGEAAKGVSEESKANHPEIPWASMSATRDRLIHGYFSIDLDIVWEIVSRDLPPVIKSLESALGEHSP
ncbi:MAG: HepT-like ribonuclease domain-containing protein [Hyphomicrobium sp.]